MTRYEVLTYTICDGWINCWTDTNEDGTECLTTFDSYEEAEKELHDFIADTEQEFKDGNLSEAYSIDDYIIRQCRD